jgi:hypothetical protein
VWANKRCQRNNTGVELLSRANFANSYAEKDPAPRRYRTRPSIQIAFLRLVFALPLKTGCSDLLDSFVNISRLEGERPRSYRLASAEAHVSRYVQVGEGCANTMSIRCVLHCGVRLSGGFDGISPCKKSL